MKTLKPKGHETLLRCGLNSSLLKKKSFTLIRETFRVFFMDHNVFHLFLPFKKNIFKHDFRTRRYLYRCILCKLAIKKQDVSFTAFTVFIITQWLSGGKKKKSGTVPCGNGQKRKHWTHLRTERKGRPKRRADEATTRSRRRTQPSARVPGPSGGCGLGAWAEDAAAARMRTQRRA